MPPNASKQPMKQSTLSFSKSSLGISKAPPLPTPLAVALLPRATATTSSAASSSAVVAAVPEPPAALSAEPPAVGLRRSPRRHKGGTPLLLNKLAPVILTLSLGWNRVKAELSLRSMELKKEVKAKRAVFRPADKSTILKQVTGLSDRKAASEVRNIPGYEKTDHKAIGRWRREEAAAAAGTQPNKKARGRTVDLPFEQAVLDEVIYTSLQAVNGREKAVVEANVAYSYALLKRAARKIKASPAFQNNLKVQGLKFSDRWVGGLLKRHALRRRRITATEKKVPEPAVIQKRMSEIQSKIRDKQYTLAEIISADETGIFFGAAPKHQIVAQDSERASAPDGNEKARYTDLLWGTAAGEMGPPWHVIKCSVKGVNLSTATVLKTLHQASRQRSNFEPARLP